MAKKTEQPNMLQQLKSDIRNKCLGRLYFFHGEETFLLHHYLEQMKKLLLDELTEAFNFHKFTSENFEMRDFADAVENLPMMAENTFVWVDEVDLFKLTEGDREKAAQVLSDIPEYCTVVFSYVTTPFKPDKRLKKLWDAVDKNGCIVEFAKQTERDLIPWIGRHFSSHGKRISNQLCAYLIEITGGTMTALSGEIAKIAAYSGADEIRKSDIDAVTEPVLDAVVFQMTDLLSAGETGAALGKLHTLLKMQQEPIGILGAIGGHFRRMAAAKILLDCGKGSQDLMRLCNMQDYPARKTMGAAGRFSARFYAEAAKLVMETDNAMKTSFDDPDRLLELLIMRLAQEAKNG